MRDMYKTIPEECPVTVEHALIHVNSALDDFDDMDQMRHDLWTIKLILLKLLADK